MKNLKNIQRTRRHARIRMRVSGTADCPRLVVFRSLKRNYAQLVDDAKGAVLAAASDTKLTAKETKTQRAKKVGLELAKKALEKGIKQCVFDRGGWMYHGRVKAIADGAREGGLKF